MRIDLAAQCLVAGRIERAGDVRRLRSRGGGRAGWPEPAHVRIFIIIPAADGHRGFGYNEARKAFELVWTQKNYEVLTEILARMPVDWRFFVKHRVFDAIERMPEDERTGTGEEVRRAFTVLAAEYPELAEHAAG